MTRDDIIRMAREAGFTNPERLNTTDENLQGMLSDFWENLERFSQLVAAAEREACAKVCDEWANGLSSEPEMEKMAAEIRARGQQ